jgi:hypothetical protein
VVNGHPILWIYIRQKTTAKNKGYERRKQRKINERIMLDSRIIGGCLFHD